jgi:hypothetical protein
MLFYKVAMRIQLIIPVHDVRLLIVQNSEANGVLTDTADEGPQVMFSTMVMGEICRRLLTVIVTKTLSVKCYFACEKWISFSFMCHSLILCFTFPHRCQQADIKKQQHHLSEKCSEFGHFLLSLFKSDP